MSTRAKWSMHPNSLSAYHAGRLEGLLSRREAEILAAFRTLGRATDREVCAYLGLPDMNNVRPRITELINEAGLLEEVASITCPVTRKPVRVSTIRQPSSGGQLSLPLSA